MATDTFRIECPCCQSHFDVRVDRPNPRPAKRPAAKCKPATVKPAAPANARGVFLSALRALAAKHPAGTLLPLRELRHSTTLDKVTFDQTAIALSREGKVILHHHDYASSLAPDERAALVRDGGTFYVGIALAKHHDTDIRKE
jgi:hypothetical protein